ncbi:MAG TPA: chromosome segregation protein SMC [Gemmatimonadales bacterium]|nr:chromosome segregation protein SMC [Gemmatimonadales bacterium]
MKLTKLELSGFKSFADTVTLTFDQGVTAIVGPNGCGKSNVSDAVRWVLGEQSARLLRGGKMEDVIFQGAAGRRPVNVVEVSLYLDNSEGELPTPYTEVVITRRLSRSGQSEYQINKNPARLRDIQDLLRGTGLGSDAGVVIEAKMIDLLLSDRADERRSLFEEAAGVGLYRDRRHTTARRIEETGADLQRLEDLIAEVQSQLRSLARQKGKAERHASLTEEKFAVTLTLARRRLEQLAEDAETFERRHADLTEQLPAARERLSRSELAREEAALSRAQAERHRTTVMEDLAEQRLALGRLDGDLALAAERLASAALRRERAATERGDLEVRLQQARLELGSAQTEREAAQAEFERIKGELGGRADAEQSVRQRLQGQRDVVRRMEQELQQAAQAQRSLEGERTALDGELASLRDRIAQEEAHRAQLAQERKSIGERLTELTAVAERHADDTRHGAARAEQARLRLRETRDREARELAERRALEDELAKLTARRSALEALERDRVGMAPAAAALLGQRERFGDAILGTLADFIATDGDQAELAEQLLGDAVHAVLVRDEAAVQAIQAWHASEQPGTLILLPATPGPRVRAGAVDGRLRVQPEAEAWVAALVGGSEVLDAGGRALRRASGAIVLTGPSAASGPLRRRAELTSLGKQIDATTAQVAAADAQRTATQADLAACEQQSTEAEQEVQQLREAERHAVAAREDASRRVQNFDRELTEAATQLERLAERLQRAETRVTEVDAKLAETNAARVRLDEALVTTRATLTELEAEQEQAREARSQWQVQEAHVAARLRSADEAIARTTRVIAEAESAGAARTDEIARLDAEQATLEAQRVQWQSGRDERQTLLVALETAAGEAEGALQAADTRLATAEGDLAQARRDVESMSEEHHRLELGVAEAVAQRKRIVERVETEWKRPFDVLAEAAPTLDLDLETLETEAERIAGALEQIGPVNALAVEEHAEESKRLTFLQTQRDDLVAARQSLLQAIKEIDGTAKALFSETFQAIRTNFINVFQTLFGGGECDLRLSDESDPLEAEIEIHAAPRGKRTQRIHLLSSGERTLVATSLLFAIYLTKPSPFCLMDEVDAPLDDANVGRFLRLLDEFKEQTQFLVITHNPRTMQSADSVYGVTMQEPGVSTIVGVRLGEHVDAA